MKSEISVRMALNSYVQQGIGHIPWQRQGHGILMKVIIKMTRSYKAVLAWEIPTIADK